MSAAIQLAEYSNEDAQATFRRAPRPRSSSPIAFDAAVRDLESLLEGLLGSDTPGSFYTAVRGNLDALGRALRRVNEAAPAPTPAMDTAQAHSFSDRAEALADALATSPEREDSLRMFILGARALERALSWNQGPISTAAVWEKLLTFDVCRCVLIYSNLHGRVLSVPLLRQVCQVALVNAENAALELWPLEEEEPGEEQPA
jgi:hypothetical protein